MYDVVIIGAGVIGCSIARELSKYKLNTCVLEKCFDVSEGTTKANSAIVHAGYDAKEGTLKAKLNVNGNKMFDTLSKELDFPFRRNGSLVICFKGEDINILKELKQRGEKNGVKGLKIIDNEELNLMEPNIVKEAEGALYAPTGGIVCPYEMTIALAENAFINGVEFNFNTEVSSIKKKDSIFKIETNNKDYETKIVINAAGLFSDDINNMISKNKIEIVPRKGEYCLFDKAVGNIIKSTLFQMPTSMGKGILVTPTVDGNLLIGPNAYDQQDKIDISTTQNALDEVLEKAKKTIEKIPTGDIITSFSGIRAHSEGEDFIIGESKDIKNFINVAGIESPGLSAAPAIGKMVKDIIFEKLTLSKNEKFNPIRKGIPKFRLMNNEERKHIIKENDAYGKIVCRCEMVTEGEIVNAINRPLGARTIDGIKRRTRAGMGRCQSGFCTNKIVHILSRELNIDITRISKFNENSNLIIGEDKEI